MFYVGQKVVCIVDYRTVPAASWWVERGAVYPDVRTVYTVRRVWMSDVTEKELLHVGEIDNSHLIGPVCLKEPGFRSSAFRPVVNTDISVFTAMLNDVPARIREFAE